MISPKKISVLGIIVTLGLLILLGERFLKFLSTLNLFLLMYVFFSLLGFLVYALEKQKPLELDALSPKLLRVSTVVYLAVVISIFLVLKSSIYVKPLSYYLLVSLGAAIIGVQIISRENPRKILFEILLLALIIRSSTLIINPYLFGPDVYWHFNRISEAVGEGDLLPKAGHYYYYPAFHLLIYFLLTIGALFEKMLSAGGLILSLFAIVAIYFLGKEVMDERAGLMGALLLSISTFHIFGSINYSPMINGFSLMVVGIYMLIKSLDHSDIWQYARSATVFWLAAVFVITIHPVASLAMLLLLGGNFAAMHLIKTRKKALAPFFSYLIGYMSYLAFVSYALFRHIIEILFVPAETGESPTLPTVAFVAPTTKLLVESAVNYLGPAFLMFFGIYGGMKFLEAKDLKKLTLLFALFALYLIPFISFFKQTGAVDPGRMLNFIEGIIVIPAAAGLIFLCYGMRKHIHRVLLVLLSLSFLTFFSTFSYITWDSNQILKDEVIVPIGFVTQSTLAVHPFLQKLPEDAPLYTDHRMKLYLNNKERGIHDLPQVIHEISYRTLNERGYFGINNEYLERILWKSDSERKLFLDEFAGDDKIYDNGNVQVFKK
jgi:hypothetical protein